MRSAAGQTRLDTPSLYHLVEAALAGDEPRFHTILGHLTHALIEGGMEAGAVRDWAERVCAILGLPPRGCTVH